MELDEELIKILACPQDKGPLYYFEKEEFFYNPRLRVKYLIKDGIPVFLTNEAVTVDEKEHALLEKRIESKEVRSTFSD